MSYHARLPLWKPLLEQGLSEDQGLWDWSAFATTSAIGAGSPASHAQSLVPAQVVAKADGVWAGEGLCAAAVEAARTHWGAEIECKSIVRDGARVRSGDIVVEWKGQGSVLLQLERPFLNLAQYACGIATATAAYVEALANAARSAGVSEIPRVTPTRKTLPFYRDAALEAVRIGGGVPHRISLGGGVLLKENHLRTGSGIAAVIQRARAVAPHGLKIEIEVTTLDELAQACAAGAEVVMLDNFTPDQVRAALAQIAKMAPDKKRPLIEVSGGIQLKTIGSYAIEGVDVISVGSITHSVQALDLSMLFVTSPL